MSSLRITGGTLRGRRVAVPPHDLRPTSERARQAYFNIVAERVEGARFLDLFAGSGIFSFEAISRGAASATAVDRDRRSAANISRHAAAFTVPVLTVTGEVLDALKRLRDPFDLVYADPPYDYERYHDLLDAIGGLTLAPDAIVALEHRRRSEPFEASARGLTMLRRAEYGEVWITFFRAGAATEIAKGEG
jgi:16S rRNA (guanine(966)-N(2))-methyltransferase RsmD